MQIQYYGLGCFKIMVKPGGRATEDIIMYIDPTGDDYGLRSVYGSAHIILYPTAMKSGGSGFKGNPIVFDCPGEFSSHGISIEGIDGGMTRDGEANTLYSIRTEGMRLVHLGRLHQKLTDKQIEIIDGAHIVFVPVGGNDFALSAKEAVEAVQSIGPSIVIPMYYAMKNVGLKLDDVKKFCDESGASKPEPIQKLSLKAKDLDEKETDIVVFESMR